MEAQLLKGSDPKQNRYLAAGYSDGTQCYSAVETLEEDSTQFKRVNGGSQVIVFVFSFSISASFCTRQRKIICFLFKP